MRVQVKRRLRNSTELESVRALLAGGTMPLPPDVTFAPAQSGSIAGEWVRGKDVDGPVLLYLHGGGYFACSPVSHRPITAAFAQRGFSVFVPDYRLAPEHPFPAAIEDAVAAWRGLVAAGHPPDALSLAGDSAGGGLSLALLLSLRDAGEALPAACCLFSPWTDLAGTGDSLVTNARREAMFYTPGFAVGAALYLNGVDAKTPLASPLFGDLTGLPPLLIQVGEREALRDDSTRLAEKARATGVSAHLDIWPVVPHVWQLMQFVPEARQSMDIAARFLRNATGGTWTGLQTK